MANSGPAKVTVTSTTGPGQSVTSLVFTDITAMSVNFGANIMRFTHQGSGGTTDFDYSAMATLTWTISSGSTAIVVSS